MLAIAALFVCAVFAQPPPPPNPPRPNISEDFYAHVNTQLHYQDQDLFGDGHWAVDTSQNKGVEDYQFQDQIHHQQFFVLNLERYDIGEVYQINSEDRNHCQAQKVTGQMPDNWGWVAQANYDGVHYQHGQAINVWNASFGGVQLAVGVTEQDPNVPVFLFRGQTTSALIINFDFFNASTNFNQSWFDVPPQCNAEVSPLAAIGATPTRPNPSEVFEASVNVQFQRSHDQFVNGQGRLASDQPAGEFVEDYALQSPRDHNYIRFFNLLRYDLGKSYYINSNDYRDCQEHPLNGSAPLFWSWISQASFIEQRSNRGVVEDIWSFLLSGVNLTISVADSNVNVPLWLARQTPGTNEFWAFNYFNSSNPNPQDFSIPPECAQL